MSLPSFSTQESLFGVGSLADALFTPTNRFRLFGEKIWPLLVQARPALESLYCRDNGRPAAEPVVLAGVCLLQFLERAPDRAALELLTMHLGWKRALHRDLDAAAYDPSLLTYFRDRLLAHDQGRLVFDTILEGLRAAGLVPQRARQRLDSTHVLGVVRQMSWLECVRETLRLALETLARAVPAAQRAPPRGRRGGNATWNRSSTTGSTSSAGGPSSIRPARMRGRCWSGCWSCRWRCRSSRP